MLLSEHTSIFLPTTSRRPGTSKHGEKEEPGGSKLAIWRVLTGGTHKPGQMIYRDLQTTPPVGNMPILGGLGSGNLSKMTWI